MPDPTEPEEPLAAGPDAAPQESGGTPQEEAGGAPQGQLLGFRAFLLISFLSLFLEILLIRWCGAEIRILAYLKNLTLLGCFLGLGLGYAASGRRRLGLGWTFGAVALLIALAHPELARRGLPNFRALSYFLNFSDMNAWRAESGGALSFIFGLLLLGNNSYVHFHLKYAFGH